MATRNAEERTLWQGRGRKGNGRQEAEMPVEIAATGTASGAEIRMTAMCKGAFDDEIIAELSSGEIDQLIRQLEQAKKR